MRIARHAMVDVHEARIDGAEYGQIGAEHFAEQIDVLLAPAGDLGVEAADARQVARVNADHAVAEVDPEAVVGLEAKVAGERLDALVVRRRGERRVRRGGVAEGAYGLLQPIRTVLAEHDGKVDLTLVDGVEAHAVQQIAGEEHVGVDEEEQLVRAEQSGGRVARHRAREAVGGAHEQAEGVLVCAIGVVGAQLTEQLADELRLLALVLAVAVCGVVYELRLGLEQDDDEAHVALVVALEHHLLHVLHEGLEGAPLALQRHHDVDEATRDARVHHVLAPLQLVGRLGRLGVRGGARRAATLAAARCSCT